MMNFTCIIIFKNSPIILLILEITMLPIELGEKKNLLQNSFVHWKRKESFAIIASKVIK